MPFEVVPSIARAARVSPVGTPRRALQAIYLRVNECNGNVTPMTPGTEARMPKYVSKLTSEEIETLVQQIKTMNKK